MAMCKNVGTIDRVIRAVIGVGALVLAYMKLGVMEGEIAGIIAAVVGVALLFTASVGMCTLYIPFKISTCKKA
jgi:Protein of unknown function (DUF2892)